jgi:formate/nitrite transporter FocA (FNT family)
MSVNELWLSKREGGRYWGVYKRVAAQVKMHPSFVSHVGRGDACNALVLRAIHTEIGRIDTELAGKSGGAL